MRVSNGTSKNMTYEVRINGGTTPILSGVLSSGASSPISTFVLSLNNWFYIEFQASLDGGGTWASLLTTGPGGSSSARFDDLYVTDDEFLGDVEIRALFPNADGAASDWTPLSGGTMWQMIDEHVPDGDTSYIYSPTATELVLVNMDDILSFSGTIKGAQALNLFKKSDVGESAALSKIRNSGATIEDFPADYYMSYLSYLYDIRAWRKSPFTTLDFTVPEIDALQQGKERTV